MLTLPPVKRTLYVERLEVAAPPEAFEAALRSGLVKEELAYSKALIEAGKIFLGGDYEDPTQGGLTLFKAASLAEAQELARARPFTRAGLVRSTVLEWQVRYESPLG
ncbi:MAG TPA: YciI family protein [Planctomycetota bacterium]|jgi:uncharacterized protein YciI|nr:YciI family protein [Planctomycetota bacterium]